MNKINKGFTLIELLVVIAIIGILSSVVLASLNTARGKGADAAIKSNLSNIRAQAEILYDGAGNYSGVCADPTVVAAIGAAKSAAGITAVTGALATAADAATAVCHYDAASVGSYAIQVTLKTDNTKGWCVDAAGKSTATTFLAANDVVCP